MINTLWRINLIDIESTLSHVCQAVLKDPNTSDSVRDLRGLRSTYVKLVQQYCNLAWNLGGAKTAYRRKNSLRHESK
ncbi:chaperone protein dnaJ 10-like [Trifolium pratense]|uniref:Chaperone protein dnaJ 10-like n=1 Tax=Trifolium pratense TaxID=57577 RepID=A0A2K3P891_TRIPR|nr:chaperone protein dnaJ 10-like [Trifolium pratense]